MDAFYARSWNLDQVVAWARSCSLAAVRYAETAPRDGNVNNALRIEIKAGWEARKAWRAGRDIQVELWASSGLQRPEEDCNSPTDTPLFKCRIGAREIELEPFVPTPLFPIEDYLLGLFRNGILTAHGNLPGDPLARQLSKDDWGGLVIGIGGSLSRRGVWSANATQHLGDGGIENVRIALADVLRVFPAEPPSKEMTDDKLETWIRAKEQELGKRPPSWTWKECPELRERGVTKARFEIALGKHFPNVKRGRPQKQKCPETMS